MKKMIYAVKSGRRTGIFKEWLKCSEQTNKYPNSKFRRFEYRSELEDAAEDVPGSLRYAIKEAEKYLWDLVYLGESADYLEDASWEEEGFLPFGDASETENPELFPDKGEQEEEDAGEDASGEKITGTTEYWMIAQDMKKCIHIIRSKQIDSVRKAAANNLKKHLERCLSDENLSELTTIYKDLKEENVIGYNPHAVANYTFMKKGVGGFIESKYFRSQLEDTYKDVCCQMVMETLTARHQVLTYETKKEFDGQTNVGSIIFCDFKLETAVESEDKSSILPDDLRPNKSWDDIFVSGDLKKELQFFIEYLKKPKEYRKAGIKPRGVLLYGPAGTGKTSLAKVVASESGVNFLSISASEFLNGGPWKVQDTFRIARKYAPAILFIDEIDAIGMKREYSYAPNPILNALLTEMDGFISRNDKPVFVIAATNRGNEIDFALQRRFDISFEMGVLEEEERRLLLEKLINKQSSMFDISGGKIKSIAARSKGLAPAKLEKVVEAALREGIRSGQIIQDDLFDEIFEKCTMGEERVNRSPKEIKCTAYHEAGHTLIDLYYGRPSAYMSIVARGNHGGYVLSGTEERDSTKKYYLEKICSALGGRAAEMIFDYGLTHGAASDLEYATSIAADMVCKFGMYEEEIGLAVIKDAEFQYDQKAKELINRILSEQLKEAIHIIESNKDAIERLVKKVMENGKKYLTEKEILETAGELNTDGVRKA